MWLSYNQIEKLEGLNPCIKLHTLFMSNNRIKSWDEVSKLAQLPEIKSVLLVGNQVYAGETDWEKNAPQVIKRVPNLDSVDSKIVTPSIRKAADELD